MGIAVSSSGRLPILGRLRLPRAPPATWGTVAFADTCGPRPARGLPPRGVVPTARVGAAIPLASVDAPAPPAPRATTGRILACPRPVAVMRLGERLPARGRSRPVGPTPVRRRCMPQVVVLPRRRPVSNLLGLLGFADGRATLTSPTKRSPVPRTSRSSPRTPVGARALLEALGRAMRPCRLLELTPLPLVPLGIHL